MRVPASSSLKKGAAWQSRKQHRNAKWSRRWPRLKPESALRKRLVCKTRVTRNKARRCSKKCYGARRSSERRRCELARITTRRLQTSVTKSVSESRQQSTQRGKKLRRALALSLNAILVTE